MANRIVLKRSSVALKVPLAGDLVAGELAVNLTDKVLYTKDASGNVVPLGGSGGGTGTVTGVTATAPVVSSGGAAPVISMAAANTSTPGYLTAADWNTFNGKQAALGFTPYNSTNPSGYTSNTGTVTGVTATGPVVSSGGTAPVISMAAATASVPGYLTAADWATFNGKQAALGYTPYNAGANTVLTSANYTSYSPSLTGSGASGTWGISISGNAATINSQANSATITASSGVNGSQIVQRDGNGYIYANHINFSTSETENPTINSFLTGNGDGWSRKSSLAHVKNSIRGVADGTWGINVTGSAGSAGSATWAANVYLNSSSSYLIGGSVWAGTGGYPGYQLTGGNGRFGFSSTGGNIDVYADGNFYSTDSARLNLYEDTWLNNKHFGSDGNIYSNASMRAPIFYDQNNTGFYVDAASTSVLNRISTVRTDNWLYIDNNYGHSVVGVYASTRYQGVFSMGDAYKLPADGTTTGNLYGIAWSHPNAGGTAGNLNTHGALLLENGGFLCALSGSIRCRDDMRTPIYYDSNDTGFYGNYASQSRLNELRTIGRIYSQEWIQMDNTSGLYSPINAAHFHPNDGSYGSWRVRGSRNGWGGLEFDTDNGRNTLMIHTNGQTVGIHNNSYGWKFQWEGGRMYCCDSTYGGGPQRVLLMEDTWQGSKHFASSGAIYGTLLYDANNTGYYCDPNVNSRMNAVIADNLYSYGTVTAYYSDDRLKTRFSNIADALDKVCSLNGFFYVGNSVAESLGYKKKMEVGLSAQEMQRILPEVVVPAPVDENYLTIQYDRVVPLLVEAIKELRLELNQLKSLVKL
jgi:hypothetical protein